MRAPRRRAGQPARPSLHALRSISLGGRRVRNTITSQTEPNREPSTVKLSQSVSQLFHGPAPRSPLHRLAVRLEAERSVRPRFKQVKSSQVAQETAKFLHHVRAPSRDVSHESVSQIRYIHKYDRRENLVTVSLTPGCIKIHAGRLYVARRGPSHHLSHLHGVLFVRTSSRLTFRLFTGRLC